MARVVALLFSAFIITSCGGLKLEDFKQQTPELVLEDYFSGKIKAWGHFQDRFDKVRRRFTVDIDGSWDGTTLTLVEDFLYDDGETEQRIWRLQKTGPKSWEGRADGVIGVAKGSLDGNAFNWRYSFDLKVGNDTLRVDFDDWLWLQDDRVLINRAYVSKFGFRLGEALIFFMKEADEGATEARVSPESTLYSVEGSKRTGTGG